MQVSPPDPAATPDRIVAVDWSGDKGPGQRKKIWSAVWTRATGRRARTDGGSLTLRTGLTREQWTDWLLSLARETPDMVVGLDCCFSYPAWFLREQHCPDIFTFWRLVAQGRGEHWLTDQSPERDERFWGKPHKRPAQFSGEYRPRMFRITDWDNKIEQALEGGDPVRAALMGGITPKSPFQIGGSGSVGTGSLRAMAHLLALREAGFRIWPFEASSSAAPVLVEMYTRLLTGPVAKSNEIARRAYLKRRAADPEDTLYRAIPRESLAEAQGSEDAFDALVCCLEMVRHRACLATLQPTQDPDLLLEGITWRPGV